MALTIFQQTGEVSRHGNWEPNQYIFNPQRIILGWSLGQAYDLLPSASLEESINRNSLADALQDLDIVPLYQWSRRLFTWLCCPGIG